MNTDGTISFGSPFDMYPVEPLPFSGMSFLAVFWADIYTLNGGTIYYRSEYSSNAIRLSSHIAQHTFYKYYFAVRHVLIDS